MGAETGVAGMDTPAPPFAGALLLPCGSVPTVSGGPFSQAPGEASGTKASVATEPTRRCDIMVFPYHAARGYGEGGTNSVPRPMRFFSATPPARRTASAW